MQLVTVDFSDRLQDIKALVDKYDHPMMPVLAAVNAGKRVIDIEQTFTAGGLNSQGLPRLAFGRDGTSNYWNAGSSHRFLGSGLEFPSSALRLPWGWRWQARAKWIDAYSVCPPVPKEISKRHTWEDIYCWEVDQWDTTPRQQLGDPVLLRPLHGRFYQVIAEWDLTPLERELFSAIE